MVKRHTMTLKRDNAKMEFIDLKTQYERHKEAIDGAMQRVLEHGQFIMGPEVGELESQLAAYVGVKHCITVSSGTHSLEIALRALGIGPGDEVITVPFSWISSAEVIPLVGATPVFVDIDPDTYVMDSDKLEEAITERTKAIIPVSLFGQMPDLEAIEAVVERVSTVRRAGAGMGAGAGASAGGRSSDETDGVANGSHGIAIIEDAAQSFGATRHGVRSCGASLIGSTSFFPAKPFGCYGDGGALFTDDDDLAEAIRAIRTHGGVRRHHHTLVGTNGRLDTLQAAVMLAKFPHFPAEVEARDRLGARYTELFQDLKAGTDTAQKEQNDSQPIVPPAILDGNTHVYAQYTVRVVADQRENIRAKLKAEGIPTGVYYPACFHEQPVFQDLGYQWGDFPESERASREVLSLPMHPWLTEEEQQKIVRVFWDDMQC